MEQIFIIEGMTCGHCVAAVEREISGVAGVSAVKVDLASGQATVTGDAFTEAAVRDAVDEAGYAVV